MDVLIKENGRWVIPPSTKELLQEMAGMHRLPEDPKLIGLARKAVAKAQADYARFNILANGDGPLVEPRAFDED